MKVSGIEASRRPERLVAEGALLRLPIDVPDAPGAVSRPDRFAESLPPVPTGFDVTVSFSSPEVADEHGDAITLLGYSVVGVHASATPSAMLLVTQALLEAHPTYWRSLAALADAAYSLALGPALVLLDDVLRLHAGDVPR